MDLAAELSRYGPNIPVTAITIDQARAYCGHLAQTHYENFTVVSRLAPRHLRQHFCNLYAYCRWADDLADEINPQVGRGSPDSQVGRGSPDPEVGRGSPDPAQALDRRSPAATSLHLLAWWEQQLDAMYAGEATHPVFIALADTVKQFNLLRQPLADLLVAFRRDQYQTRYETLADLLTYCEKSANPLGRLVLCLGQSLDDENARLSDSICTGLQLANFWQDVRRDYERGRIYLPQDRCCLHGWDEARFAAAVARPGRDDRAATPAVPAAAAGRRSDRRDDAGRCDNAFRELLRPLVDEAESLLLAGQPLVRRVSRDLQPSVQLFIEGGRAILAAIRRSQYDVWSSRPTVGRLTKLRLLATTWWRGTH